MKGPRLSLDRIRHLVVKELLQTFRNPRMTGLIFVAPIGQLLVFGYAVSTDVRHTRTFLVDHDNTQASRRLADAFEASGYFRIVDGSRRSADLREALDKGRAVVGLEIPVGFARDLARGDAAVQLLLDGTNSNTAAVARGYAERVVSGFGARAVRPQAGGTLPGAAGGLDLQERAWFNPGLVSRNYNVPAIAGVIVTLVCLLLTALAVVREREIGTLEQLRVSPMAPGEMILGKTIPFALVGLFDLIVVMTVAVLWFEIPFRGSLALLFAGSFFYLLSALGVGLLISTISSTQQEAFLSSFLFFMPTVLLSGFMFPVSSMPEVFQVLTLGNPLRHYVEIVRGIFLKGAGIDDLWRQFAALAVMGAAVLWLASVRFRREVG